MSELKRHHINEVMDMHNLTRGGEMSYSFVYYADDVDRVIAEKDAELRHHKYKRCLAIAELCRSVWAAAMFIHETESTEKRAALYMKWQKRWLELAEKFKEAK